MTIDKFDFNLVLFNINKLKPYRFVENHTFQLVIVKLSNFSSKELVETNHFGNMFNEELVETNHFGNMFIKEPVKLHTKGLITNNLIEKIINYSLSNQEFIEENINDLLKKQLVGNTTTIHGFFC